VDNVRDIEGVLVSLIANSVVKNRDIDIQLAKQVISQTVRLEKKTVTIKMIQEVVCRYFNLNEELIQTSSRKSEIVQARQITMYLSKKYTESSYSYIGTVVGNRDHATVHHSCKMVKEQMEINKSFRSTMEVIEGCLKN
jgi:chromosomal replication initiator protein